MIIPIWIRHFQIVSDDTFEEKVKYAIVAKLKK
jgi:hypothetical protein